MSKGFPTVDRRLFSSGMHKGVHTRAAIVLAVVAGLFLLIPSWSNYALLVFFSAGALGLLGEAICILNTGELISRKGKFGPFIIIRRSDHPIHFWFHVCAYALLGMFCLAISIATALFFFLKHAT